MLCFCQKKKKKKIQTKKLVLINIKDNVKNQQYMEQPRVKLILRQYVNQKPYLIIQLLLSQKNQVTKIFFLTNKYSGS